MSERSEIDRVLDKGRIPNFTKDDYIVVDGKKRLNPNWEQAREERLKKDTYFRCPLCNQGSVFIGIRPDKHTHGIRKRLKNFFTIPEEKVFEDMESDTGLIFFFHPRQVNGEKQFATLSFELFKEIITPTLWREGFAEYFRIEKIPETIPYAKALILLDIILKESEPNAYTLSKLSDFDINIFYCLPCLTEGTFHHYTAEELIKKYHNPIDDNCDYEAICNVCGSPVTTVMIPKKIPDTDITTIESRLMCSYSECSYDYTPLGKAETRTI